MAGRKELLWAHVAEQRFVMHNESFDKIVEHIASLGGSVSKGAISYWKQKCNGGPEDWDAKRSRYMRSSMGIADVLQEQLDKAIRSLVTETGQIDADNAKLINQLSKAIDRIAAAGPDLRTKALEIMGMFAVYVREQTGDPREMDLLDRLITGFMGMVEGMNG